MLFALILIGYFSGIVCQGISVIDIEAVGEVPGSSFGIATAQGAGAFVDGLAEVIATDNLAQSSAIVTASSGGKPKPYPYPYPKPYPYPDHKKAIPYPVPTKHYDAPKCGDYKDDKCYYIDEYDYCGFCIEKKYPLKGYGCKYVEEKVKKSSGSKKVYDDYEIVIKPLCDCKGDFILKKEYCPSCDLLLVELLECAGIKDPKKTAFEIPEKCLKVIGVTPDYLVKCGFIKPPSSSKKVKEEPKVVIVKPEIKKKEEPKVVVVEPKIEGKKKPAVAVASASAVAVSGGH